MKRVKQLWKRLVEHLEFFADGIDDDTPENLHERLRCIEQQVALLEAPVHRTP